MEKRPGVYRLQSLPTGRFYIGSSKNVYRRYYRHRQILREGLKENLRIKEDCDKYGPNSFIFGVIEYCEESELREREQYYFELWNPQYNVRKSVYDGSGRTYTEEQLANFKKIHRPIKDKELFRKKLKEGWEKRRARCSPEELSKKLADARRGIKHSEETKAIMSANRKGKKKSPEWIEKFRERRKGTKLIDGKYIKLEGG
jgi:group I intron endonuclease